MKNKQRHVPAEIHAQVARQIAEKAQRLYTLRMAGALCATLLIPEGSDLVLHLTDRRDVRSNREAVAVWIESQLADPNLAISQAVLPIFVDLLSAKLRRIQEGYPCS